MSQMPDPLIAPVLIEVGQAMFYYCDEDMKLPVGIIHSFSDDGNHVIRFPVSSMPVIAQTDGPFAAELFFYRKAFPFCITVIGRAEISSHSPLFIRFTIEQPTVFEFAANSYRQVSRDIRKKSYDGSRSLFSFSHR